MVIFEVMTRTFDHIIIFIGPDHIRNCKMRLSIENSVHIFEEKPSMHCVLKSEYSKD